MCTNKPHNSTSRPNPSNNALSEQVGMGTIQVQDDDGNALTDPNKQEHQLTKAEEGAFYIIICECVDVRFVVCCY